MDKDSVNELFEIDEKPEAVKQTISRYEYGYGDIYANDYDKDRWKFSYYE